MPNGKEESSDKSHSLGYLKRQKACITPRPVLFHWEEQCDDSPFTEVVFHMIQINVQMGTDKQPLFEQSGLFLYSLHLQILMPDYRIRIKENKTIRTTNSSLTQNIILKHQYCHQINQANFQEIISKDVIRVFKYKFTDSSKLRNFF